MDRLESAPRGGWRETVEAQGLTYAVTPRPDGSLAPYWYESAAYRLNAAEVEYLEAVTEELHAMCIEAAKWVLDDFDRLKLFNLDPRCGPYLRASLNEPSVYGRFDLAYRDLSAGHAKLLEYNADTPTGLVEAAVVQWYWLEKLHPDKDQWNSLHERLIDQWRELKPRLNGTTLHLAHSLKEESGEEWMTVAYMRDVAMQAGYTTYGLGVEEIGWPTHKDAPKRFIGLGNEVIKNIFKLYAWEDLLADEWGDRVLDSAGTTTWIEPAWKALLSNKALLPVLWQLHPNHPNLLEAHFDAPSETMLEWIAKPLHGREGDGIRTHTVGPDGQPVETERPSDSFGQEGYVYQAWHELPDFDGNYAVIGSWIVGDTSAGIGIRESDGPITDYYARFVPHFIDGPRPSKKQIEAWLAE